MQSIDENLSRTLAKPHSSIHRAEVASRGDIHKNSSSGYTPTEDKPDPSKGQLTSKSSEVNAPKTLKIKLLTKYKNKFK
jgi:hypothetical protein